jgi:hypothetical protein
MLPPKQRCNAVVAVLRSFRRAVDGGQCCARLTFTIAGPAPLPLELSHRALPGMGVVVSEDQTSDALLTGVEDESTATRKQL